MQRISSKENDTIKHIKKLRDKKERDISNEYIIEGIKLIGEAIKEKVEIKQIVICEECEKTEYIPKELMFEIAKYECIYVTEKVFKYITEVKSPQGIIAVVEKNGKEDDIDYKQDIIVALDDIQDPGNLGTILRTVDSIGLTQILVSKGTADAYNPKVVRSTMGAIFRVNIIECEDLQKKLKEIKRHKFELLISSLQTDNSIYDVDYNKKVIVVGNEANGVKKEIQDMADEKIKIPMLRKNGKLKRVCGNRNNII
ncbi:MAG: RNA methyltransferase [Clostridia bacterium]|nr:RNA methyltransferase [Clostridia bacterium]